MLLHYLVKYLSEKTTVPCSVLANHVAERRTRQRTLMYGIQQFLPQLKVTVTNFIDFGSVIDAYRSIKQMQFGVSGTALSWIQS